MQQCTHSLLLLISKTIHTALTSVTALTCQLHISVRAVLFKAYFGSAGARKSTPLDLSSAVQILFVHRLTRDNKMTASTAYGKACRV